MQLHRRHMCVNVSHFTRLSDQKIIHASKMETIIGLNYWPLAHPPPPLIDLTPQSL